MQSKKAFLLAPFSIRDYPGAAQWSERKKKKEKKTLLHSLIFEPGQRQVLHKIIFCAAFLMFGNSLRKRGNGEVNLKLPDLQSSATICVSFFYIRKDGF